MNLGGGLVVDLFRQKAQAPAFHGSKIVYRGGKRLLHLEFDIGGRMLIQPCLHIPGPAQDLLTPGDDIVSGSFQGRKETILVAAGDLHCRDHVPERYLEWPAASDIG